MNVIRKYLTLLLVGPFLVVATLLWLLTQGLHQFPLAVSQEDLGFDMPMAGPVNISQSLAATLDKDVFALTVVKTRAEADALLAAGTVKAALTFPPELTEDMFIKTDDPSYVLPNKIQLTVAGDNPLTKLFVVASLAESFVPVIAESGNFSADSLPIPIDFVPLIDGFANASTAMITTLMGFLASVLTGVFAMLAGRELRKTAALSPHPAAAMALGAISAFALTGTALYLALLSTAFVFLNLTLTAQLLVGSAVLFALLWACAALGLAAASNAPERAFAVIPFLIVPLFLGGILFPAELMPTWLQWLALVFPAHYGLAAAGNGALAHYPPTFAGDLSITLVFALLFTGGTLHGLTELKKETPKKEATV